MKFTGFLLIIVILLVSSIVLSANALIPEIKKQVSWGAESDTPSFPDSPPPLDSVCMVFQGVDYGTSNSAPTNYPNARHAVSVRVGTFCFPVVTWETGSSWHDQSLFSYYDDFFPMWSYPDSFTSNDGEDTGRPSVCADSKGNLYFVWHQNDGARYECYFTKATLDTTGGLIAYAVQRPATIVSGTGGYEDGFPVIAMIADTLIMVTWGVGGPGATRGYNYNYSKDGGTTWEGAGTIYDHGGTLPNSGWTLLTLAGDPNTGDMWAAAHYEFSGDGSNDAVAWHWDAATDVWGAGESIANATCMHPYVFPHLAVDSDGIPYAIWQENKINDGGSGGIIVYNGSGPFGQDYISHRTGGVWSSPKKIMFPRHLIDCNYQSGWPVIGIANDNTVYFAFTQPETALADTGTPTVSPFQVFYGAYRADSDSVYYGGKVSDIAYASNKNAIFPQITYDVHSKEVGAGEQGPGMEWCQATNAAQPFDIFYCHKDTLIHIGVEETKPILRESPVKLYQNYPNPVNGNTMIRFTIPNNTRISLKVYDISGRLVKTLADGMPPGGGSYFIVWNGKDLNDKVVPAGIYLYTLTAGSYNETRKAIIIN